MCLELAPFKECGFGDCVNGECVCYPGVIQNVELLYHPVPSNITTYCDYNVEGSVATTAVLLAFSLCVFIVQVLAIHNAQQLRRQVPILVGYFALFVALSIRLARPADPLWGFDFAFTFCMVISVMVYAIQIIIFLNRYVEYLDRTLMIKGRSKAIIQISRITSYSTVVLVVIGSVLWIVPVFVDDLETSGLLTKLGCGIWAANCAILLTANTYLLTRYLLDVEALVKASKETSGPGGSSDFIAKCEKQIPRMKTIRVINMTGMFLFFLTLTLATALEGWLKQLTFVIYGIYILYQLGNFCIIRTFSSRHHKVCGYLFESVTVIFEPFGSKFSGSGSDKDQTKTVQEQTPATFARTTLSTTRSVKESMSV